MLKQTYSFALAAALLFATAARPAYASPLEDKEARRVEKLKERLAKCHERGKRRVVVRLKDGRKLKGRVADVTQSEFVLADKKTGAFNTFRYDEVKEVRLARPSHQWVGPVVGFAILAIATLAAGAGLDK